MTPSPNPSHRRQSPPPRVILGRVIQLPPGAASQGRAGERDLAAGTLLGPGHWPGSRRD